MVNPLPKILSIFMHGGRKYQESVFDLPAEDFFLNDILKVRGSLLMRTFCFGDVVVFLLFFLGGGRVLGWCDAGRERLAASSGE